MHAQVRFVWLTFLCIMFFSPVSGFSQPSFVPSSLPGLVLWLTGDSVDATSPPFIDKCYDLSPMANHALQTTAASRPVLSSQTLNGHKFMSFDGQDDYLQFSNINSCKTIFWIIKETPGTTGARPVLGHSGNYDFLRGGPPNYYLWNTAASSYVRDGLTRINSDSVDGTTTTLPQEFVLISLVTTVGTANAEFLSNDRMGAGSFWNGDVAELIIYDQWLTISEVQQVENYLYDKYAPVANLGPDLTIANSFCDTTLSPGNGFTSYIWSNGDTTASISVNQSGQYWVQTTGIFGNVTADTVNVTFNAPSPNFLSDSVFCAQSVTWNSNLNHSMFNFQWQDNSTDSFLVISSSGIYSVTISDAFGCSVSSVSVAIGIDNFSQTASLGADTSLCGDQYIYLKSGASGAVNYTWSDNSVNDSLFVSISDTYWLTASSINGCSKTDTINITVNPVPVFSLGNDTVICFNESFAINPDADNSLTFLWSDNSADSLFPVNSSGNYWLQLTNSFGCNFSDSVTVSVDSTLLPYTSGPDTSFCSGNYVVVSGAGAPGPLSYLWSDLSNNDTLQVMGTGSYWVQVTNSNGCVISDSINVTVSGIAPTANFTADTSCFGNANAFTDLSLPPMGNSLVSWQWNFGDGFNSSLQNPLHTYSDTGLFMATLTVLTDSGCVNSFSKLVKVYPNPAAGFIISNLCEQSSVLFNDTSVTFGYPLSSWQWNFNDPSSGNNSSSLQNPQHIFANAGTYMVQLVVTGIHACSDTVTETIVIKSSPVSDFNVSLACNNEPVLFTDSSTLPSTTTITSSYWDFGDMTSQSTLNATHTYSVSGSFTVLHFITASNGCEDSISYSVTVHPDPVADFGYSPPCVNDSVYFTDNSGISGGAITSYNWNFNNAQTSSLQDPAVLFNISGAKSVTLTVTSDQGCVSSDTAQIVVSAAPTAAFSFSPSYGNPPLAVTFTNSSIGAISSSWNFGDSSLSSATEPTHVYADTGAFIISLNVFNSAGCSDVIMDTIFVITPRLDVAVIGLTLTEQNNFVDVTALLQNKGTIDVSSMELYVKLNNGTYVKENWTGTLNKGAVIPYHFTSQFLADKESDFICAMVKNPNSAADEVPENDELCSSLDSSRLVIYPPYPNPATEDLTLGVNIPRSSTFKAVVYDSRGRELMVAYDGEIEKGMRFIPLNTTGFEAGIYLIKIEYQGKVNAVRFMKRNP